MPKAKERDYRKVGRGSRRSKHVVGKGGIYPTPVGGINCRKLGQYIYGTLFGGVWSNCPDERRKKWRGSSVALTASAIM